jgi:hypothetical protein
MSSLDRQDLRPPPPSMPSSGAQAVNNLMHMAGKYQNIYRNYLLCILQMKKLSFSKIYV